ncbi:MAG: PEP-CTERM sorting domain-containing protein [Kiritimatiellae bacterium]|nr:PEP-CTERM sorting domain-containing protein [Kiritimatiellia bacterium]
MKTIPLAILVAVATISAASADLVYDIDYEPPAYTNGQQIGGGNTRTISDSIPGFTSQALLLHDGGGISYYAPQPYTTGLHSISWDFGVPVDQSSTEIIGMLLGSAHVDVTMSGSPSSYLIEYGPFPLGAPRQSVPFQIGQVYSFHILLDLDSARYALYLNGNQLLDDAPLQFGSSSLDYVSFGQSQTLGLQAGLDNFRWEVIPEPISILLILLGGSFLISSSRRKHEQKLDAQQSPAPLR